MAFFADDCFIHPFILVWKRKRYIECYCNVKVHFFAVFDFFPALSKVFKFADVEETGYVDVATISTLAVQLLGAQLSESEKETINSKAENKAEKGIGCTVFCLVLVFNVQFQKKPIHTPRRVIGNS